MEKNNYAVSPVISAVLALLIVSSTMASVFVWGIPYIDQLNTTTSIENSAKQFASVMESIGDLTNSNPNDSRIDTLNIDKGEVSAGTGEGKKDRTVIMYSYDEDHNFTVSRFDTCFLTGTKVLMADRSYKNIEGINIGDMVLSYDERTRMIVPCKVANVFAHSPDEMADYYLLINNGLRVTSNHRFYSDGKWVYAGNLKIGDSLFSQDQNSNYQVNSIKKIYEREQSFDLEVENCHTYFVSVQYDGVDVLVHNIELSGTDKCNDTSIREYPPWNLQNFGKDGKLSVDCLYNIITQCYGRERTLIKFDLSSIPSGSTITNATLKLYYSEYDPSHGDPNDAWLDCHRLLYDWAENDSYNNANWVNRSYDDQSHRNYSWGLAGGDFAASPTGSCKIPKKPPGKWMNWTVKSDVQNFSDGLYPNFGWLIKYRAETTPSSHLVNFSSSENGSNKPKLQIKYLKTETLDATNVKKNKPNSATAKLLGYVTSDGEGSSKYRFYYKKFADTTWEHTFFQLPSQGGFTGKTLSYTVSTFTPGSLYIYRGSIHNITLGLINNGSEMSFLTPDNITGFKAAVASPGEIDLNWTLVQNADGAYIEWYTSLDATWNPGDHNKLGTYGDGYCPGTSFQHTGLTPDTLYYYKAWAYAEDGPIQNLWKSRGNTTAPFGNNWTINNGNGIRTYKAPYISTNGSTLIHSRDATLNGYIRNTSRGEHCKVWFEYGLTTAFGSITTYKWMNTTGTFSIFVDGLKPGTTYYFRAVYKNLTYVGRAQQNKSFTTFLAWIEIVSPQYGDNWRRGITHKIEWLYRTQLSGTYVNITLIGGPKDDVLTIASGILINNGLYNWSIPSNQSVGKFNYRIEITSDFDPNIYDYSDYFSIKELHEGIVWNKTILLVPPIARGNTGSVNLSSGESFNLTMMKGNTTRAEVYGLYYGGELDYCSFSGAVQIDLYEGGNCFGTIILLDSDSLTYKSQSNSGPYSTTIENGGIFYSDSNTNKYLQKAPPIYAGEHTFSMHAVQLVASPFGGSGSGGFRIRIKTIVNINSVREADYVYNLRLQFYGDNAEAWLEYFESNYDFEKQQSQQYHLADTLFYKPSTSKLWFTFAHTAIGISFQ